MQRLMSTTAIVTVFALTIGCSQQPSSEPVPSAESASGSSYLLSEEPQDAQNVIDVRENAQDDGSVVVVGRIGGSPNPWVEGRSAFSIVDLSLKACSDIEGDTCQKPWDYCCQTDLLPKATVLVKLVDDSGELVAADSRELLPVKELDTVVVDGTARRDDAGNVTVLARKIYVRP